MFGRKSATGKHEVPMPEGNEGPPDSNRPSGLCPRCSKQSSFQYFNSMPLTFNGGYMLGRDGSSTPTFIERSTVLICRHCNQGISILEEEFTAEDGKIAWRGFQWWPLIASSLHNAVPKPITSAFLEATQALSANCPRASAVMARRTLEAIAADKGEANGTLAQRLKNLSDNGTLHSTLSEWSKEVRLIGNKGAHYDPLDDVSVKDARQLNDFIHELVKYLYVLPAELNARRAQKP